MEKVRKDVKFGLKSEKTLLYKKLGELWGHKIIRSDYKYSKYDYYSKEYFYELKTRRYRYNAFEETIIPVDKVIEDCNRTQIFLFRFYLENKYDDLFYIIYDEDKFKNFKIDYFRREDRIDENGNNLDKEKLYFFIPIKKLMRVDFTQIMD